MRPTVDLLSGTNIWNVRENLKFQYELDVNLQPCLEIYRIRKGFNIRGYTIMSETIREKSQRPAIALQYELLLLSHMYHSRGNSRKMLRPERRRWSQPLTRRNSAGPGRSVRWRSCSSMAVCCKKNKKNDHVATDGSTYQILPCSCKRRKWLRESRIQGRRRTRVRR